MNCKTEMETAIETSIPDPEPKPKVIYRCKKCRRIVASAERVVSHERGGTKKSNSWKKASDGDSEAECSSIFVEPMKWMKTLEEGNLQAKLHCLGCKARLGCYNWAGIQCNCGAWVNPAFQLHKSRLDECVLAE
ncbi:unnamed protein product [Cuscuta epithymum]|uniref:Uncharacterized protein n=2 Tax=Cuscuta epithymum TaxID=186058 RepID=A0AAV0EJ33_9ASTE|nr:unnamed protein product [Cuscuta epithymum]